MKKCFVLAVAMMLLPSAYAAVTPGRIIENPLVARTLDSFTQEAAKIHQQMQPGGIYEYIKPADKARVEGRLDEMRKLLKNGSSHSDMPRADKVALLNAQEEINGILMHNDANRLVCESRAPVGSHLPITQCRTYGEVMAEQRQAQKWMQDLQDKSPQLRGGN